MDDDRRDYLIELDRIVERQIKVYGDLLDRISNRVRSNGLDDLADEIIYLKRHYGLGEYKPILRKTEIKEWADIDLAQKLIVRFLTANKNQKYSVNDILINLDSRLSGKCWWFATKKLLQAGTIKATGRGRARKYWIE